MRHNADTETKRGHFNCSRPSGHRHIRLFTHETAHRSFSFPTVTGIHCRKKLGQSLAVAIREQSSSQASSGPTFDTVEKARKHGTTNQPQLRAYVLRPIILIPWQQRRFRLRAGQLQRLHDRHLFSNFPGPIWSRNWVDGLLIPWAIPLDSAQVTTIQDRYRRRFILRWTTTMVRATQAVYDNTDIHFWSACRVAARPPPCIYFALQYRHFAEPITPSLKIDIGRACSCRLR